MLKNLDVPVFENHATRTDFIKQFIPYHNEIPIVSLDQRFKGFATTNIFHNFNISGLPTRMANCVKINFKDGRSIVCEENVEWKVNKRVGLVKSKNLVKSMSVVQNAIEFNEKELPVSPYVVGAHLGDGSSQAYPVVITSIDLEIVERCAKELNCTAVKVDKYNWKFKPMVMLVLNGIVIEGLIS